MASAYLRQNSCSVRYTALTATVSRLLKSALDCCGVDIAAFSGHSTRSAATPVVHAAGIPIDVVCPPETCGKISEVSRKRLRGKMPQIAGSIADFVKNCGNIVVKLRPILVLVVRRGTVVRVV